MEDIQYQRIPVLFPGSARFQNADGAPSGAVGATATVEISINLQPQMLVGIRVANVYAIPTQGQAAERFPYYDRLDEEQTLTTELTQSNIIVRAAMQSTVTGRRGFHWHPFSVPYLWRGGNNLTMVITRLTSYPDYILPTAHVTLEGIMLVKDSGA